MGLCTVSVTSACGLGRVACAVTGVSVTIAQPVEVGASVCTTVDAMFARSAGARVNAGTDVCGQSVESVMKEKKGKGKNLLPVKAQLQQEVHRSVKEKGRKG
mmetsp:Transcript_4535/g.9114  ORF Transcript_4535/g.9114 Transcript_4535/m.9114 type:complete len:102 (+) Transcript_4535:853-1158(+)